jgi:hypothetical protein
MDHDGQAVIGNRHFHVLDAVLSAQLHLAGFDRSRGVRDVGLAQAEFLEAAPGARDADRHAPLGMGLLELLGHGLGDREHRTGAVNPDDRGRR